jgi:hypothetical protein
LTKSDDPRFCTVSDLYFVLLSSKRREVEDATQRVIECEGEAFGRDLLRFAIKNGKPEAVLGVLAAGVTVGDTEKEAAKNAPRSNDKETIQDILAAFSARVRTADVIRQASPPPPSQLAIDAPTED